MNNKGITLIALVITVIILLILAAVSVSMITGNDGLFSKANEAGTLYNEKAKNEADIIAGLLDMIDNESKVELSEVQDKNEFAKVLLDTKKATYILNRPEVFMDVIFTDQELATVMFSNNDVMNLLIRNNTWRDEILNSNGDKSGANSVIIKALDNSNTITLPTTGITLYDATSNTGNVLYSTYLRNDSRHSPINAFKGGSPGVSDWESSELPAYIGYDFGENNEVWVYKTYVKGGNDTTPTNMILQASDDNETWQDIYECTLYTTKNNYVTEVADSAQNNKKHRYWRLYITASGNTYIDLLKLNFYAK